MSSTYEVSLGEGPLGLRVTNNTAGNKLSAIVEKVSGQAEGTGIEAGHLLVSINSQSTTQMAESKPSSATASKAGQTVRPRSPRKPVAINRAESR